MPLFRNLIFAAALTLALPALAAQATIDPAHSTVTVHVYKTGFFSALAHDHTIGAPIASGFLDPEQRSVSLAFNATDLKLEDTEGSASEHREIETTMKGESVLDAARFPIIKFQSKRVDLAAAESYLVTGDLQLHGKAREITIPVVLSGGVYRGSLHLKQSDYGITPVKVAGGAVKVKDVVDIDFTIVTSK